MQQYPAVLLALSSVIRSDIQVFFTNLRDNRPKDILLKDWNSLPEFGGFIEEYMNFFVRSGKYKQLVGYGLYRFPESDPLDVEDAVQLSIWKALYLYPWDEGFFANRFNAYLCRAIRIYLGSVPRSRSSSYDIDESDNQLAESLGWSDDGGITSIPDDLSVGNLIDELMGKLDKRADLPWRREVLALLAQGYTSAEASEMTGIAEAYIQKFLNRVKKWLDYDTSDRVDSNPNGQWSWNAHTAHAILSDSYLYKLLEANEVLFLEKLRQGWTHQDFIMAGEEGLYAVSDGVKIKVQTLGRSSKDYEYSERALRTDVVLFLQQLEPMTEHEAVLVSSLLEAKGNVYEAARISGVNRSAYYVFMKRMGFYEVR